jgi:hypothetical protein
MVRYNHIFAIDKVDLDNLTKGETFSKDYDVAVFYANGSLLTAETKHKATVTINIIDVDLNDSRFGTMEIDLKIQNSVLMFQTKLVKAGTSTSYSKVTSQVGGKKEGSLMDAPLRTSFTPVTDATTGNKFLQVTAGMTLTEGVYGTLVRTVKYPPQTEVIHGDYCWTIGVIHYETINSSGVPSSKYVGVNNNATGIYYPVNSSASKPIQNGATFPAATAHTVEPVGTTVSCINRNDNGIYLVQTVALNQERGINSITYYLPPRQAVVPSNN